MRRRSFLKSVPVLSAMLPAYVRAERVKISDIRLMRVRLVKEIGGIDSMRNVSGSPQRFTIGGVTFTEIHTDSGLIGLGPGISPGSLESARARLVGSDPFDSYTRAVSPSLEIAIWDLVGKAANQPLYRLWGASRSWVQTSTQDSVQVSDKVLPYGALWSMGPNPEYQVDVASRILDQGWRAVKLRASFPTLAEDVRLARAYGKLVATTFLF